MAYKKRNTFDHAGQADWQDWGKAQAYVARLGEVEKGAFVAAGEKKLEHSITIAAISRWYNGCLKV